MIDSYRLFHSQFDLLSKMELNVDSIFWLYLCKLGHSSNNKKWRHLIKESHLYNDYLILVLILYKVLKALEYFTSVKICDMNWLKDVKSDEVRISFWVPIILKKFIVLFNFKYFTPVLYTKVYRSYTDCQLLKFWK